MSVELRPLGVKCNIQCQYCYQHPQRDAAEREATYDLDKMKSAIVDEGGPFTLFGGEALLVPFPDLEELFRWGHEQYGGSSVQTNGTLLTDAHVELFLKYNVQVGVSVDGPGELNDVRWSGSLENTRANTERSLRAIEKLAMKGLRPALIITLHRGNASPERLDKLISWIQDLQSISVRAIRLHLLESEDAKIRQLYALSEGEYLFALAKLMAFESETLSVRFDLFSEMRRLLLGEDRTTSCVWYGCDPYTTSAVRGVEGQGQKSNCGRTNKDGVDFVKSPTRGYERYIALYNTPQEHNGCKGCRFFLMCKGQCPGTAIDHDWRNKTEHCEVWKSLYHVIETSILNEGGSPLSLSEDRYAIESQALASWASGRQASMFTIRQTPLGLGK